MEPAKGQLELDFSRAEKLGILRDAIFPSTVTAKDGGGVKASTLKLVLGTLDHYGRGSECWPAVVTIAEKSCLSQRQTRRAIDALESIGVLIVVRRRFGDRKASGNHYRLVWSELALLCPGRRANQSAMVTTQSAMVTTQSAMVSDPSGHAWPLNRPKKRAKETPPPNPLESDAAAVAELCECGVAQVAVALEAARKRGLSALDVQGVCQDYRANRAKLKAGAIVYRLRWGEWPAPGVIPAAEIESRRQAAAERESRRRAEDKKGVLQIRRERNELAQLERDFGKAVAALPEVERDRLARIAFPKEWALQLFRREPHGFSNRLALLRTFASLAGASEGVRDE